MTAKTAKPPIVVIGTTLGEASDPVVATGAEIARAMGAVVHLVHAFDVPAAAAGAPFAVGLLPGSLELEKEGRERLREQVARLRHGGGRGLVQHVEPGPPHRVLSEVARREAADLIVVGASDDLAAHVFGSTASRVVRKAQCPVLVLRGALPVPPRQVLLPIDLSPISGEVVTRGLALIGRWCGAGAGAGAPAGSIPEAPGTGRQGIAVEALHVVAPRGYEGFVPHFDVDATERAGVERLGVFLAGAGCAGWRIERRACFGGPREEILNRIAAARPDLVVMGTHGLGGFDRFMLGSVAESVVRASRTSVLVMPPLAAAGAEPAAAAGPPPVADGRRRSAA